MRFTEKRKIRKIARKVRESVERLAQYEKERGLLYGKNPDTLCGYCIRASFMLSYALTQAKFDNNMVYGEAHAYVKCKNHIIDVTATQFGYGKTLIRKSGALIKGPHGDRNWSESVVFKSREHFMEWQNKQSVWPQEAARESDLRFLEK